MSDNIIMPQLGETVAEGKILTWFKSIGDDVKLGDKLFEVETDKVTVEVEAIAAGKLSDIKIGAGVTAKVGTVVAVLENAKETSAAPVASKPSIAPFEEVKTPLANFGKARNAQGIAVSPLARRLIVQMGVDPAVISAHAMSKGLRRIGESDVRAAMGHSLPANSSKAPSTAEPVPLSAIRQKTAARLAENWRNIPHVFQAIEVDFTLVDRTRVARKEGFQRANGTSLTYLPFVSRAVCIALQDFPHINATFDGNSLKLSHGVNLGVAIDLSHQGLVVPVVRNAGDLTVEGLARAIARLTEKARAGKLTTDDLGGGTYSITNNGAFGTLFTSPIINAPQVAILSMDSIRKRPAVVSTNDGDFIAPRLLGILGQSFDHRAFDGAYSASFLSRLKHVLETHDWSNEVSKQ